jgi:Icc-related predicted phosphoesterase
MVKITHISDTHGAHSKLKFNGGDILIHSGDIFDFDNKLTEKKIYKWFDSLPYKYKILVPGNHDQKVKNMKSQKDFFILNNDIIDILNVKIYGFSACLIDDNCLFKHNTFSEEHIKEKLIYKPVDVFITHGAPKNIFDIKLGKSIGSLELKKYVEKIKPKYHLFGHSHHSTGIYSKNNTIFINNSIVYNSYIKNIINNPIDFIIDVKKTLL